MRKNVIVVAVVLVVYLLGWVQGGDRDGDRDRDSDGDRNGHGGGDRDGDRDRDRDRDRDGDRNGHGGGDRDGDRHENNGISAADGKPFVCRSAEMIRISNAYLAAQVTQYWNDFIPHVADEITIKVLSVRDPIAQGKEAAVQVFLSLGKVVQSIDRVVDGPINYLKSDAVSAQFTKTQRSLSTNVSHNLTFVHTITFNRQCKVTDITEVADLLKTADNFPLAFGTTAMLFCKLLEKQCAAVPIDWGTSRDCFHHWQNAPQFIKDDELKIVMLSKSLACLGRIVDTIESMPPLAELLCPEAGVPIPGKTGCW